MLFENFESPIDCEPSGCASQVDSGALGNRRLDGFSGRQASLESDPLTVRPQNRLA